jgi:hypothetical protein
MVMSVIRAVPVTMLFLVLVLVAGKGPIGMRVAHGAQDACKN